MKCVVDELPYYEGVLPPFGRCAMIMQAIINVLSIGVNIKSALMIIRMSAVFLLKRV